jgi:hypothetical protein
LVEVITLSANQPKLTFFRKKGVLTVISNTTRLELFLLTILFGLLGLVLFLAPVWSAENFPWSISPMVAMTMAGWCLGNAFIAGHTALKKQLSLVYPGLLYLFLFGVFEVTGAAPLPGKIGAGCAFDLALRPVAGCIHYCRWMGADRMAAPGCG